MPRKVVIDTDFGTDADDAIAIALALASDEIQVQAFTTVGRQSIYRKQTLETFLASLGKDFDVPPVYAGWDEPPPVPYGFSASLPTSAFGGYLSGFGAGYRFNWFGNEGVLDPNSPTNSTDSSTQPPTSAGYAVYEAGQQLSKLLSGQHTDYIGIGPLTNLYQLMINPRLDASKVAIPRMTVMGIHLNPTLYGKDPKTGKPNFVPEGVDYNLGSDVVSALYVLNDLAQPHSIVKSARFVTADVTLKTWLRKTELAKSLAKSKNPFLQALVKIINEWTPIQTNLFKVTSTGNAAFLHDPLTVACAYSDRWCNFKKLNLELVLTNTLGLRWVERPHPMANTISVNCAVSLKPPPSGGKTFQQWMVGRLLKKFN
ncbi:MAG: nucleoside hydrolase [Pyrinomonadaceae bacterium]|nr:nucleoside hydrolase [Pyrinomonadaceae bacterium]